VIATCGLGLALLQLARDATPRPGRARADAIESAGGRAARRRTAEICGCILGMFVAIQLVGVSLATLATTLLYLRLCARERWAVTLALSLAAFAFVYGLFEKGLGVPFPPGRLLVWLGGG
jgi:hypothetical protein